MTTPAASPGTPPPLPRFALKVGLVGNRRFGKGNGTTDPDLEKIQLAGAKAACAQVWPEIVRSMEKIRGERLPEVKEQPPGMADVLFSTISRLIVQAAQAGSPTGQGACEIPERKPPELVSDFFASGPALLTVLTSLAAGVDQFGARAALDHGQELRTHAGDNPSVMIQLESIMPFGEANYPGPVGTPEATFTAGEAAELHALANDPHCVQTVRLDGLFPPSPPAAPNDPVNHAYRQARDFILQNSDLLVAVFDPKAKGGAAGTLETVEQALNTGIPVLAVLVSEREEEAKVTLCRLSTELIGIHELLKQARPLSDQEWCEPLEAALRYLLALPQSGGPVSTDPYEKKKRAHAYVDARHQLEVFLGYRSPDELCCCPVRAPLFAACWHLIVRIGIAWAQPHGFSVHQTPKPRQVEAPMTVPPYSRAYERAEALSKMYMDVYRGAFPLAFLLASTAAAAAVIMMVMAYFTNYDPPLWMVCTLGGLKVSILCFLLWLEHTANHQRWQEHAAEYRYMAELLRPMQWLAPLGSAVPVVELPAQYAPLDPIQGWMHWLFRAMARSVPSVCRPADATCNPAVSWPQSVEFSTANAAEALREGAEVWLESQRFYHWGAAQRHHQIENGLEHLAKRLLIVVLICAVAASAMELGHPWFEPPHTAEAAREEPHGAKAMLEPAILILTALAAALPAFIAALTGIIFQSEAKRLELRSEAMFHGLKTRQEILAKFLEVLPRMQAEKGGATRETAQRLRTLAGLMIAETGDWKALYQMQDIKAG